MFTQPVDGPRLVLSAFGDTVDRTGHLLNGGYGLGSRIRLLRQSAGDLLDGAGNLAGGFSGLGGPAGKLFGGHFQFGGALGDIQNHTF